MNHLTGVDRLVNRYHAMRHGQSKANVAGVIVAAISDDRGGDWGLTELGRRQALAAAEASALPADTAIWSSDFARAHQTAQIAGARLGAPEVALSAALRERRFGDLELSSTEDYALAWAADESGSGQPDGVEPVTEVLDRMTALVADLERRFAGRDVLLVSHGDPLQILQAGFLRLDPARHRHVPPLETAEIRRLHLAPPRQDPLPDSDSAG